MKNILLILMFVPLASFGQTYSNYYGTLDVNANVNQNINANVNVNKNVDVSGNVNVNKTVTSIDYGALRLANAQREKNRLEQQIYANEEQKRMALEIASNPLKAFDYGTDNNWVMNKDNAESIGFKKGTIWYHKIPNKSLFVKTDGYNYRNESEEGVLTEIEMGNVTYLFGTKQFLDSKKKDRETNIESWKPYLGKTEKWLKEKVLMPYKPGVKTEDGNYIHKVDLNKAKVYTQDGFVWSFFYENDYDYVIKDNYWILLPSGTLIRAGVRYSGDKDEVDFEMLEGRREYFKRLARQTIATANILFGKKGGFND
jgi:hypothetical protein